MPYIESTKTSPSLRQMGPLRVCVFGSSSKHTNSKYVEESVRLGKLIAQEGYLCVNGAGSSGCMGGVNKGRHIDSSSSYALKCTHVKH